MHDAAMTLSACLALCALYGALKLHHASKVDETRSKLFTIRDKLFRYALENDMIGSAASQTLRKAINSSLRYTHRISFLRLIFLIAIDKHRPDEDRLRTQELSELIGALPQNHRRELELLHKELRTVLSQHLVESSVIMKVTFLLALPFLAISGVSASKSALSDRSADLMERDACAA